MRIIQMPQTEHEVDAFLDMWRKNLGPQDGVAVNPYTSWAGLMDEEEGAATNGNGSAGNGTPAPARVEAPPPPPPPAALEPPSAVPTGVPGVGVRGPCRMLWKNFTVLYDGRVTPCCIDAEGELIIGNVQKSSIKEIWHGAQLKKLRELHKKGEWDKIPICARCREWI
jgi:radical SAM protein with 4Fe4S-binding SPASM domain